MNLQSHDGAAENSHPFTLEMHQWALSISRVGIWSHDLTDHSWRVSPEAAEILGCAGKSNLGRDAVLECLSSIDRLRLETAWSRLIDEGGTYDLEYLVSSNGCERWIWERVERECSGDGEALRLFGMVQDVTGRRAAERKLQLQANYDALTQLPNRYMLDEYLEKGAAAARRRNERMALMAIDLDRFKQVNDTHGHAVGDQVLLAAAERMKACLRASDMLARHGGDEFIAVLTGIDFDVTVGLVALRLIEEISRPFMVGDIDISIGASVGIALMPEDGIKVDELLKNADCALYEAKRSGRETLNFYETYAQSVG